MGHEDRLTAIERHLAEIHTAIVGIDGRNGIVGKQKDHENRIRGLERWRFAIPPAVVLGVASIVVALATGKGVP